jgi:hypothetical protein
MGQPDAIGFGRQAQETAIGIESVGAARLDEFERALLAPIDQPLADPTINPEHEIQRIGAESRHLDHLGEPRRVEAAQASARLDVIECRQVHPHQPGERAHLAEASAVWALRTSIAKLITSIVDGCAHAARSGCPLCGAWLTKRASRLPAPGTELRFDLAPSNKRVGGQAAH